VQLERCREAKVGNFQRSLLFRNAVKQFVSILWKGLGVNEEILSVIDNRKMKREYLICEFKTPNMRIANIKATQKWNYTVME